MRKQYVCVEGFSVEKCDDDGFVIENEYSEIEKGTVWELTSGSIIGADIHLEEVGKSYRWLEITKERFELYFQEVKLDAASGGAEGGRMNQ